MKAFYDEKYRQTDESREFGNEIQETVEPIFKRYLDMGFSIRDLSHEAQAIMRDIELDYILDHYSKEVRK